jgi:hypothetical protein
MRDIVPLGFRDFNDLRGRRPADAKIWDMAARIIRMQVFYNTSEQVKVGSEYYQLVYRHSDAGFEVGIYHGELASLDKAASPNDATKTTFESDVAEYYLLKTQQEAEARFAQYSDETEQEGYQPYVLEIHEP